MPTRQLPRWRLVLHDGRVVFQYCSAEELPEVLDVFDRQGVHVKEHTEHGTVIVHESGREDHVWPAP